MPREGNGATHQRRDAISTLSTDTQREKEKDCYEFGQSNKKKGGRGGGGRRQPPKAKYQCPKVWLEFDSFVGPLIRIRFLSTLLTLKKIK